MTTLHLRKSIGQSPLRLGFLLIPLALACFALPPTARALLPAPTPDGGYPNENTAEGSGALFSLTTGGDNTANGFEALFSNTTGNANTADGSQALFSNTTGSYNTAIGRAALGHNTTGFNNTATGRRALILNTTGINNTANGFQALVSNTTGNDNTAEGFQALGSNTTGNFNTSAGPYALFSNTTGQSNTATGTGALFSNTIGVQNTANGAFALFSNTTGSNNIALGFSAGSGVTTASNVIALGTPGTNVTNSCFIGNIRGITTANADAIPVLIDSAGQLGTISSSRRFKNEIKPMDKASEAILALKPVTFHYKSDKTSTLQFGLIAEEVAEVNPDLVVRDEKGEIYTVRYDAVNAMLLNEFLKEHRTVQELKCTVAKQEATIAQQRKDFEANTAQQQKEIQALTASLTEQAAQIQEVSAQLEVSKPAPRTVRND